MVFPELLYFTAGVSTSHGNSPSFKVFDLENESSGWNIENYSTYQLHKNKNDTIEVSKFYDFLGTYCSEKDTTFSDINGCLDQIDFDQTLPQYTVNNPNYPTYVARDPTAFYIDLSVSIETTTVSPASTVSTTSAVSTTAFATRLHSSLAIVAIALLYPIIIPSYN